MYWLVAPGAVNRTWLVGLWCAGALAGIALVRVGILLEGSAMAVASVMLALLGFKRSRMALLAVLFSGLLIGIWQGTKTDLELRKLDPFIGQKVLLQGKILDDPVYGDRSDRQFHITNITLDGREVAGKIRASTFAPLSPKRGDNITLQGKLTAGYGSYQARMSFAEVISLQESDDPVLQLRDAFAGGVRNAIPEPQASLGLGFLLGQRSALPEQLDEDMRRVGLTHIVVASGYNLTILVRAARRLLAGYSKFQAFAWSMLLMSGFAAVAGFSPSMTRAVFVTSLSLLAWYYGRRIHPLVLLLFAAAVTGLFNPLYVWSDIGWYLSFLAFAGVLILAPLLTARLLGERRPPLLLQICIETIAAQIMVAPLILWLFGEFSLLALLANVAVVPLIPIAMLMVFGAGIVGVVWPVLSGWIGLPAIVTLHYITETASALAKVPWAMAELSFPLAAMLIVYAAAVTAIFFLQQKTKYNFLRSSITD